MIDGDRQPDPQQFIFPALDSNNEDFENIKPKQTALRRMNALYGLIAAVK